MKNDNFKGIKTGIAIVGIHDRHTGKKPEVIKCKSVRELHKELKRYLPFYFKFPYSRCLRLVKENGYVALLKKEFGKTFIYSV